MSKMLEFPESLAEKWRPKKVRDFVGQERTKTILNALLRRPRQSAWFMLGPSGLGKTTMVQAFTAQLNAEPHYIPIAEADEERISRECSRCHYVPMMERGGLGGWHVIHIDEADQLAQSAQDALLNRMDSTGWPPRTIYFFTGNSASRASNRFLSRTKILVFAAPTDAQMTRYLRKIWQAEGGGRRDPDYEGQGFTGMLADANGNVRDAIGHLEMELMLKEKPRKKAA